MKVVFRNSNCKVSYNEELDVIEIQWTQIPFNSKTLRVILNWIISGLDVYNCSTIIADARLMNMIWKEDRKWILENWYPRAIKAGLRRQALIVTEGSFGFLAIKKIVESCSVGMIDTTYFSDSFQAANYLKSDRIRQKNFSLHVNEMATHITGRW